MITKLLNEVNEKMDILNSLVQNKEYFKKLDERIDKVNNYNKRLINRMDKAKKYITDNFTNQDGTIWHSEMQNIYNILNNKGN